MKFAKITILFLTLIAITLSCSDDDNTRESKLRDDYFVIEEGTFLHGDLPAGFEELLYGFKMNSRVLNGGSAIVSFSSPEKLSKAYVGIKGVKGYFELDLRDRSTRTIDEEILLYQYDLVLILSQQLPPESFFVHLTVSTSDGRISEIEESQEITVIKAETGDLQISLSWDQYDDLDLHVITPDSSHLFWRDPVILNKQEIDTLQLQFDFGLFLNQRFNTYDASKLDSQNPQDWETLADYLKDVVYYQKDIFDFYKEKNMIASLLDIDSNPDCEIDGINNENIYFNQPANGIYIIMVDLYRKCAYKRAGAKYALTLHYKGERITFSGNQTGQYPDDCQEGEDYVIIGAFCIEEHTTRFIDSSELYFIKDQTKDRVKTWAKKETQELHWQRKVQF